MPKKSSSPSLARRIFGVLGYGLFLLVALLIGTVGGWLQKSPLMMTLVQQTFQPKPPGAVFQNKRSLNVLLLGCDVNRKWSGVSRYRSGDEDNPDRKKWEAKPGEIVRKYGRADMILLARFDFEGNEITGISIPRDTDAQPTGWRRRKINEFMVMKKDPMDGAQLTKEAVQSIIGDVEIDRVVLLDYEAFEEMVNLVGGITLTVDKRMKYDDFAGNVHIDLHPGRQTLDGYNSLMYVRFRKGIEGSDSDFARQERQKNFLVAFKQSIIRDPFRLPQVLEKAVAVMGYSFTNDEIASLAFFARGIKPADIRMGQIPVVDGRGSHLEVDRRKLPGTLQEYGFLSPERVSQR